MYANIKNIVFDFGGVLLTIDYNKTFERIYDITGVQLELNTTTSSVKEILAEYETGKLGTESFLWHLQRMSQKGIPDGKALVDAWNAMLIGWNTAHFALLTALRQKYRVFLLSNTNDMHLTWVYRDLALHHGITQFDHLFFDKTYYSHLIGMKKPDPEIFEFVTKDATLTPQETLFIDDLSANVEAARSTGWHAYQHNPADNLPWVMTEKLQLLS